MFNGLPRESYGIVSNIPLLPIKTQIPGTAPRGNPNEKDIIDEALELFKANVLYKNFEIKGDADRLLVYLTFYISQCITKVFLFLFLCLSPFSLVHTPTHILEFVYS